MCLPLSRTLKKMFRSRSKSHQMDNYLHSKTLNFDSYNSSTTSSCSSFDSLEKPGLKVREVGMKDCKSAAATLAEAFQDDEIAFYWFKTPKDKRRSAEKIWKLHTKTMEYIVAAHCLKGLVLSVGENNEGIALWMPPGKNMDEFSTILRSGMWKLWFKLSSEGRKRYFDEFLPKLHHAKEEVMGERDANSWYLVYIGVVPSAQGRGYSRKLVEYVTKMADTSTPAVPCYLESSARKNVAIYERFGFEKVKDVVLERGEKPLSLDLMVREPGVQFIGSTSTTPRTTPRTSFDK